MASSLCLLILLLSVAPVVIDAEVISSSPLAVAHERTTRFLFAKNPMNYTYCVAKEGADQKLLQAALDWICGEQKFDCSGTMEGHLCFEPNTLEAHASVAFNMYYYKNLGRVESCDFNGAASITTNNPTHGLCSFTGSSGINASRGSEIRPPPGSSMAAMISADHLLLPLVLPVVVSLMWM